MNWYKLKLTENQSIADIQTDLENLLNSTKSVVIKGKKFSVFVVKLLNKRVVLYLSL